MMYASKIVIDYKYQQINTTKVINLGYDVELSIQDLEKYGVSSNDTFSIVKEENTNKYILNIYQKRLETDDERLARINQNVEYNKNYESFHNKKNK